jgi:pimeloyl-ACP methyl ester carboxylesterase
MPYIVRGASRLYYEQHGEGDPVVLLHGVGGNHASWFHQVVAWRDKAQVITVDARGFGNSEDLEQWGRSAFAEDLLALLDSLGLKRVSIVAQSMGGGTACNFVLHHPERVRSLVLADTLVGLALPDDIAASMAEVDRRTQSLTQLERVLGPTFTLAHPAEAYLYTALASFNATHIRSLQGEQPMVSAAQLSATRVPMLFVAGEEDVLFPPEHINGFQRTLAASAYLEIPGAGHSAYFEAPAVFNQQVYEWLAQQPA